MKSYITKFLLSALIVVGAVSCSDDEPDITPPHNETNRTVLVYMVADNNLGTGGFDDNDVYEMKYAAAQGDLGDGRLLIYYNRPGTANGLAPQLLEVTPQGVEVLKTYPDDPSIYSVEIERMRDVMADMKAFAPADGYGLVLWGHSKGWMTEDGDLLDRSYGTDRSKWMSLSSLGRALEDERFDFVYLDCCLMGSIEVIYELRHIAPFIAGSPTEVEGEGQPYHLNLKPFFAPKADMVTAAANTYEYLSSRGKHCQMVVVDTSRLDDLAAASRAIYATVESFPTGVNTIQRLSKYFNSAPPYSDCCPVSDFESYMQLLGADNPDLLAEWQSVYDACVVYKATTPTEFNGMRIYTYGGLGGYAIKRTSDITYRGYTDTQWWADAASVIPACRVKM